MELHRDFSQGWLLTILSSLLCALGCFVIFLDNIYYFLFPKWFTSKFPFHLKENYGFMNGSLGFSCGCLLFTALYRLLPQAFNYFTYNQEVSNPGTVLIVSFIGGILACVCFNQILHLITMESVVHCSHDGEKKMKEVPPSALQSPTGSIGKSADQDEYQSPELEDDSDGNSEPNTDFGSNYQACSNSQHATKIAPVVSNEVADDLDGASLHSFTSGDLESQPLIGRKKSNGLLHLLSRGTSTHEKLLGECKGYSSAERCLHDHGGQLHYCEIPELQKLDCCPIKIVGQQEHEHDAHGDHVTSSHQDESEGTSSHPHLHAHSHSHSHHKSESHHHHHVTSPFSRLLLIGVQTILAITLHKLPEGFITYVTSETDPQLGFSIFLSLLIHNYTEGFSMCLPLYYSFGDIPYRKLKAVGISAPLGALSQPLGAFIGVLLMKYYGSDNFDVDKLNFVFGVSMAVTSGFLVSIALSMYGSSVSFSGSPNFVLVWCLVGMCTIGMSTIFTSN